MVTSPHLHGSQLAAAPESLHRVQRLLPLLQTLKVRGRHPTKFDTDLRIPRGRAADQPKPPIALLEHVVERMPFFELLIPVGVEEVDGMQWGRDRGRVPKRYNGR